jgi:hypothetical protein
LELYTWRSLFSGSLDEGVPSDFWIWGEGIPHDIEPFEDLRIIVLGPPAYGRIWTAGPRFSDLPAGILIEKILDEAEVNHWMETLKTGSTE